MRSLLMGACLLASGLFAPAVPRGTSVVADRDGTLIEDPNGALANGAGPFFFAGRTNATDNSVRRALVRFDLASAATVRPPMAFAPIRVTVVLTNVTESNVAPREYRLHRLLADWGEGSSSSLGGGGAPATSGDPTWVHSFYPDAFWMHNGAQFDGEPSARLVVAGPGVYRFDGDGLARDVRLWMREPDKNFGWILIGDETERQTVRAFASRENPDPDARPVLEVTFSPAP